MTQDIALGIGCDRNTPHATLAQVIDEALQRLGRDWSTVKAVASIDLKADEVAMQQLMQQRGCDIRFYSAAQLAQVPVPNPSETVRKYTGTPSVSEAAALLAAGADGQPAPMSALLIEKHKLRGPDGRNATVSVAAIC
ncbi:cobalamin biosynthesis protein [Lautropia mirabilis]|jgi:putative cobalamin (vitamin B12) biosynthesis cbiG protein, truncated